jgi:uncharacterized protein YjbI with pentapeptide repeats
MDKAVFSGRFITTFHDTLASKQSHELDKNKSSLLLQFAFDAKLFIYTLGPLQGHSPAIESYRREYNQTISNIVGHKTSKFFDIFKSTESLYKILAYRLFLFLEILPSSLEQKIIIPSSYDEIVKIVPPKTVDDIDMSIRYLIQQSLKNGVLDFTQLDIRNFDFSNMHFISNNTTLPSNIDLQKPLLDMHKCSFNNVNFKKAILENISMLDTTFYDVNFQGSRLKNIKFVNAELNMMNLDYSVIEDCIFTNCTITVSVVNARFSRVTFKNCQIFNMKLNFAFTNDVIFENTRLSSVTVTEEQYDQFNLVDEVLLQNNKDYAKKLLHLVNRYSICGKNIPREIKEYVLNNELRDSTLLTKFEFLNHQKYIILRDNEFFRLYEKNILADLFNNGYWFHPVNRHNILPQHFMSLADIKLLITNNNLEVHKIQT